MSNGRRASSLPLGYTTMTSTKRSCARKKDAYTSQYDPNYNGPAKRTRSNAWRDMYKSLKREKTKQRKARR
jgi:hypothetical protein